jgi:type I restriction enzyme S subunit
MSDDWTPVALGETCDVVSEKVDPSKAGAETPYVGLEHIEPGVGRISTWGVAAEVTSLVARFQVGDVLFGRLRPYLRKVALAESVGVCSPEVLVLRARPDIILPGYLHLVCSSEQAIEHAVAMSAGSRMPRTSPADLASFEVKVPPLPVQRRVVDLMAHLENHIANLRAERDEAARVLAQLRGELAMGSVLVPLGDLAESDGIQIGPFGSQLHAREYVASGIPVVMPRDIVEGRIFISKIKQVSAETAARLGRHRLLPGDIVFPRRGDLSKRALVTVEQEGWLCGTGCIRYRPAQDVNGGHVFQALSGQSATEWLVEHAVGTTMLNLNTQILNNLPVPDPRQGESPVSSACEGLAALLTDLGTEESRMVSARNGLLSALLNGSYEIPSTYDSILVEVA